MSGKRRLLDHTTICERVLELFEFERIENDDVDRGYVVGNDCGSFEQEALRDKSRVGEDKLLQ